MISHLVSLLPSPISLLSSLSPVCLTVGCNSSHWVHTVEVRAILPLPRCDYVRMSMHTWVSAHVRLLRCDTHKTCAFASQSGKNTHTCVHWDTHTHTPAVALKPAFGSHIRSLLASLHAVSPNRSWILHLENVLVTHAETHIYILHIFLSWQVYLTDTLTLQHDPAFYVKAEKTPIYFRIFFALLYYTVLSVLILLLSYLSVCFIISLICVFPHPMNLNS